jgi:hypothetical protein
VIDSLSTNKQAGEFDYLAETGSELVDIVTNQLSDGEDILLAGDITINNKCDFEGFYGVSLTGPAHSPTISVGSSISGFAFNVHDLDNVAFRNFDLDCQNNSEGIGTDTKPGDTGYNGGLKRSRVDSVLVDNAAGDAWHPSGWQSTFTKVTGKNATVAWRANAGSGGANNTIYGLRAVQSTDAVRVQAGGWSFLGGEASTSTNGVVLDKLGTWKTVIDNFHHEGNTDWDYLGVPNAANFRISPKYMQSGINLPAPRDFTVKLAGTRWDGTGPTALKLGDTNAGTTAIRGTVFGTPRDSNNPTDDNIDAQSVSDVSHYSNTGHIQL